MIPVIEVCGYEDGQGKFHKTKAGAIRSNYEYYLYSQIRERYCNLHGLTFRPASAFDAIQYVLDNPKVLDNYRKELEDTKEPPIIEPPKKKWWEKL